MDKTGIEWTDATWNPIRGCSKVSEGCRNCYAETMAARFNGPGLAYEGLTTDGKWNGKIKFVEDKLEQPLRWKRPRKIFVNSMSDLFHEGVEDAWLQEIWGIMASATRHTFQILTKRPKRMRDTIKRLCLAVWPNVWLGVSVEDQKTADERIPLLLDTPASVRWISAEPLLEGLKLRRFLPFDCDVRFNTSSGDGLGSPRICTTHKTEFIAPKPCPHGRDTTRLDWVVVGGESGKDSRQMEYDWVRSLIDQCEAAKVPLLFKQWGGVNKKKAGRTIDGHTWDQYPNKDLVK